MFGVSPVKLLAKLPVPVPLMVLLFAVVGVGVVFQQTPLALTVAPPSAVTFPPLVAVVRAMSVTEAVVREGSNGAVVKVC